MVLGSQPARNRLTTPGNAERLVRLWRGWTPRSAPSSTETSQTSAANKTLAALADQHLPDDAAWRNAFGRHSYEPLLALAGGLPDKAKRYMVWNAAVEMITDTADARGMVEAAGRCQELRDYLAQQAERFVQAIDEAADNEAANADDADQVTDAMTNLEAIEVDTDLDLVDARHTLMHRLDELREQEPEEDDDVPFFGRGEDEGGPAHRLDALFWQLVEVAR